MDKTKKLYLKHLKRMLKAKKAYYNARNSLSPYEKDVRDWFAAQYKQFNPHHYFTGVLILHSNEKQIVFEANFTDKNLNGTVTMPLDKVMSLDVTFDDFVVKPYES